MGNKEEIIHELDVRANMYIAYYKDDWLKNDRPRVMMCRPYDEFIVGFHKTGSTVLFFGGPYKQYTNWDYFQAGFSAFEDMRYFHYNGKKIKTVNKDFVKLAIKTVYDSFPELYIKDCKERLDKRWADCSEEPKELTEIEWYERLYMEEGGYVVS